MPRIRLLANSTQTSGTAISAADAAGNPAFAVSAGDVVPVSIDAAGWANGDSIAGSDWDSPDGLTISGDTLDGADASCQAAVPVSAMPQRYYRLRHRFTLAGGPVRNTLIWLVAEGR